MRSLIDSSKSLNVYSEVLAATFELVTCILEHYLAATRMQAEEIGHVVHERASIALVAYYDPTVCLGVVLDREDKYYRGNMAQVGVLVSVCRMTRPHDDMDARIRPRAGICGVSLTVATSSVVNSYIPSSQTIRNSKGDDMVI